MQNLEEAIERNRFLALETLEGAIRIPSVAGEPETLEDGTVYPFGQSVQNALEYTLACGRKFEMHAENIDNYGGHIDYGDGEETVGIIGHLDVVPEGEGWDFDPFSGKVEDGYILGRGTTDDKGPVFACLMAMKSLKDAGFQPDRRIRLILGLDEETNWKGIKYYFDKVKKPDFGFTPDADFPALNGEKGILHFEIAGKFGKQPKDGLTLRSLKGGTAVNMVPESARAVVSCEKTVKKKSIRRRVKKKKIADRKLYDKIRALAAAYGQETGHAVKVRGVGTSLEITARGKAAHGASPEKGINGISVLMDFLHKLNFASDEVNRFLDFYQECIGFDYAGRNIGIAFSDEKSGALSFNVGMIHSDGEGAGLTVDVRYPVSCTAEQIYEGMMPFLDRFDLGLVKIENKEPIYFDPDSSLIRTLMDVYRENTGDMDRKPLVIGGGTYARSCENIVAFGGLFPGDPDIMHQRNEKLAVERYMQMINIYAEALLRLGSKEFRIENG